ncbi:MAG: hypothetical protein AABZ65_01265 [Candidatus Omnitrophota bacterium]
MRYPGLAQGPDDWTWSSYLATVGWKKPHSCLEANWILGQFASDGKAAESAYRKFVREGIRAESIWKKVKAQIVFGEDAFMEGLVSYIKGKKAYEAI